MAKPSPRSDPPVSSGSPRAASPPSPNLRLVYGVLKLAAFVVGLPAALLTGMALVGAVTDNGYARVLVSAVLVIGLPLAVADRLLPSHDPTKARGLVSDVCAVTWMILTCAGVAAGSATRPLFTREGDRLVASGHGDVARAAYLLAGLKVDETPAPAPTPVNSGSAAASGSASPSTAPSTSAAPTAAPSAVADAGSPHTRTDRPTDKTPAELFREVSPSVVTITARSPNGEGGGTGFLIDKDGTLVTNHHVIENATRVRVKFSGGATFEEVELLVDESTVDLALLRVDMTALFDGSHLDAKSLPLANSDDVVVGEHAIVIGNPLGLESTLTDGLVSSRRIYENRAWIQFSAPIGSGNSGGPVFNMRGEVIGVATASLSGRDHGAAVAQNLNLAVPINELKKLIRTDYPSRRKLGEHAGTGRW
jgi:S1-C subfamily serine protease